MPTDLSHVIAFLVALSCIALLGVGASAWIWRTTPRRKPLALQGTFDFASQPATAAAAKLDGLPKTRS